MKHALVIGGSGMLANVSVWLTEHYETVSVLGRNLHKLRRLAQSSDHIHPISVNYYDLDSFRSAVHEAIQAYGSFDTVVAWIHSQEKTIIDILNEEIRSTRSKMWKLFHVMGSSSNLEEITRQLDVDESCIYHQIQLGFVIEGHRSRWLTHDEIANGVIVCIRSGNRRHLVGTLSPWDRRP